jgi:antitoxin Phd
MECVHMNVNINNIVPISEANQNFSKVTRMVDEQGTAVIMKNDAPRYVLIDYNLINQDKTISDDDLKVISERIMIKHIDAFRELAK